MGFPVEMFPVLFAIPRTAGWIAQWEEMLLDPEQKIARPRQIYTGPATRDYVVERQALMRGLCLGALCVLCALCGSSSSLVAQATSGSKFDSNRAWEHLRQIVAIGPRPAGSAAIEQTRKYIKDQLAAVGLTVVDQAWDTTDAARQSAHGEPDRHHSRHRQAAHS